MEHSNPSYDPSTQDDTNERETSASKRSVPDDYTSLEPASDTDFTTASDSQVTSSDTSNLMSYQPSLLPTPKMSAMGGMMPGMHAPPQAQLQQQQQQPQRPGQQQIFGLAPDPNPPTVTVPFSEINSVDGDKRVTCPVDVPDEHVARAIGKSGQTVRAIQNLSGAFITIPQSCEPGTSVRRILIAGTKNQIKYAKVILDIKTRGDDTPLPLPDDAENDQANPILRKVVPVPNDQVGRVIGKQGITIRQLQELSGAHVEVAKECKPGVNVREITLLGRQPQLEKCEELIQAKLAGESLPSLPGMYQLEHKVYVPNDMVGRIIGKGGCTIRELQEQSGAHMDIAKECAPGTDQREITIKGDQAQVALCQQLLTAKVPSSGQEAMNPYNYYAGAGGGGGLQGAAGGYSYAQYGSYQPQQSYDYTQTYPAAQGGAPQSAAATASGGHDDHQQQQAWAAYYAQYGQHAGYPNMAQPRHQS
eukprot:m.68731 g.68731  ORF g.68731 m.68731 type:complete len:475 (-) comp16725_c0_seq2:171-1595(-)